MRNIIFPILIFGSLLLPFDLNAQSITWQKIFNSYYSFAFKSQQTIDGGYITVGSARVSNYYKIYVIKQNLWGDTQWTKLIGGNGDDRGYWIERTTDKGYIIAGSTTSFGVPYTSAYLIKLDSLGNQIWQKTYVGSDISLAVCAKQTSDDGYIVSLRWPDAKIMLLKTNSIGNIFWQKIYPAQGVAQAAEIEIVNNAGYIIISGAAIPPFTEGDIYLVRVNLAGDTLWTKVIGGPYLELGYQVQNTNDGGFILCGESMSFTNGQKTESYIVKVDSSGNVQWQRNFSDIGPEVANAIRKINNIGYIVAGYSDSLNNGYGRAKIRILDLSGNLIHQYSFTGEPKGAIFQSVEFTNDMGFILSGVSYNQLAHAHLFIVKTDSLGFANPIAIINEGNAIPTRLKLFQNYPNPFNPNTTIRFDIPPSKGVRGMNVQLKIYDITGREVFGLNEYKQAGSYSVTFDGTNYASGLYFYRIETDDFKETKKMILVK